MRMLHFLQWLLIQSVPGSISIMGHSDMLAILTSSPMVSPYQQHYDRCSSANGPLSWPSQLRLYFFQCDCAIDYCTFTQHIRCSQTGVAGWTNNENLRKTQFAASALKVFAMT